MLPRLGVATFNIHKGLGPFNWRASIHELREHMRQLDADVVFLQEVAGQHSGGAARARSMPQESQYEFLADQVWREFAYGRNAVYPRGHHGNAILSHYPIMRAENEDVSDYRFERRGLLHCELLFAGHNLHCVCLHLALTAGSRRRQLQALVKRVRKLVPAGAPLVVAGDFNDWRGEANDELLHELQLHEVFQQHHGAPARSFPSAFPLLRLDRIYQRGFRVLAARVGHGKPWSRLSDHAVLTAQLELQGV